MDLTKLDATELAELQANIATELRRKEQEKRQDVIKQVKALLAENGMSIEDLLPRSGKAAAGGRAKVAPKYRSKTDPSQTWTGRGRQPRWVVEYLAQGGSIEDLAI